MARQDSTIENGLSWGGRWEEGSGWGTHVNLWPSHVNVWQKPLQYWKVISLQLIKINGKKRNKVYFKSRISFSTIRHWKNNGKIKPKAQ